MKVAVTDANIFIDLIFLDLIDHLFKLDVELYTTHEVVEELNESQQKIVRHYQSSNRLGVLITEEIELITQLPKHIPINKLSFADLTVFHFAMKMNTGILTGDSLLRKISEKQGLDVHGIIWVFDKMIELELISTINAASKLESLLNFNKRLPVHECQVRIKKWKK